MLFIFTVIMWIPKPEPDPGSDMCVLKNGTRSRNPKRCASIWIRNIEKKTKFGFSSTNLHLLSKGKGITRGPTPSPLKSHAITVHTFILTSFPSAKYQRTKEDYIYSGVCNKIVCKVYSHRRNGSVRQNGLK